MEVKLGNYYDEINKFGIERALEPQNVLPTAAWKIDNSRELKENEVKIKISRIHIEGTSFKQICMETHDDDELIRQKIIDIVIQRGKLHNPVTDTGGVVCGTVEELGSAYEFKEGIQKGEQVICNASLASIPMHITKIGKIDRVFNQVEAEGYVIAHSRVPIIRKPDSLPVNLTLYIFNESGTIYRVSKSLEGKEKVLIVGTNLLMNLIFGYTIRKILGDRVRVVNLIDKKNKTIMRGNSVTKLLEETFDVIKYVNILKPVETMEEIKGEERFDLVINCSEVPGAESLCILASDYNGTVMFANLINNYNSALYITESLGKQVQLLTAEGYLEEYDSFDIEIVGELASYFRENDAISKKKEEVEIEEDVTKNKRLGRLPEEFVCSNPKMERVVEEVVRVSKYDCNVLITGDTGVGKEKIANLIQKSSDRKMQPFIKVNCAAIYPSLMESEFFGYEPGAFTGASTMGKKGYFELADNGILFLDEVGEIPLDMQAKLLRVIQEGEFYKVGGVKLIKTNLRIISAVNKDLEKSIEEGTFRRDLYYRLNVVSVKIPPLSERKEDIAPLVKSFLKKYGEKFGVEKGISEDALKYLVNHSWKGNIRELENTVQRLIISSKSEEVELADVLRGLHEDLFEGGEFTSAEEEVNLEEMMNNFEKQIIKRAYETQGSTRKAAKSIGISQTQFVRKKNKYEI